jgi:hypothetical protein
MEQVQVTIGNVARQILGSFTMDENPGSLRSWHLREDMGRQERLVKEVLGSVGVYPETQKAVFKVLLEIYLAENKEQAEEFLDDIEPYDNIADLTAWLNDSESHIRYVTEALQEGNSNEGVQVLAKAHKFYLHHIGRKVIEAIHKRVLRYERAEISLN